MYEFRLKRLQNFLDQVTEQIADENLSPYLVKRQHRLMRQIQKLERKQARAADFDDRLVDTIAGMLDLKAAMQERIAVAATGWQRWSRHHFDYDTYVQAHKTSEQRFAERRTVNLKEHFPEVHQAEQQEAKAAAMSQQLATQYWLDRITEAHAQEAAEQRAKRRQQQREDNERRRERAREEEEYYAEKARQRDAEYFQMRLQWHDLDPNEPER